MSNVYFTCLKRLNLLKVYENINIAKSSTNYYFFRLLSLWATGALPPPTELEFGEEKKKKLIISTRHDI